MAGGSQLVKENVDGFWVAAIYGYLGGGFNQGTIGCTPNSVPMVFIVFSRDSWGL